MRCSIKPGLRMVFLFVYCVGLTAPAYAQMGMPKIVDPANYSSPSGEYVFRVDPSDRYGSGKAFYRLKRDGHTLWSGDRPFTLTGVTVADNGIVGGYAYTGSGLIHAMDPKNPLEAVIFDRHGKFRLDAKIPRAFQSVSDAPPLPVAKGVFIDRTRNRLVVRLEVEQAHYGRNYEIWRQYALSTGKRLPDFDTRRLLSSPASDAWVGAAAPVAGTSLTLIHWLDMDNARFRLLNAMHKPVWSMTFPSDYSGGENDKRRSELIDQARQTGAILPSKAAGTVALWHVAAGRRVTYRAARAKNGRWRVSRIASAQYPPAAPIMPRIPNITLKPLGRVTLRVPHTAPPPNIRNIDSFTFAGPNRIAFLRATSSRKPALVVIDLNGAVKHITPLPVVPVEGDIQWSSCAWLGGSRYVVGRSQRNVDAPGVWLVDTTTDKASPIAKFEIPSVDHITAFPDGRFVAIGDLHVPYTAQKIVGAYSRDGKRLWRWIDNGADPPDKPGTPSSPTGVAVTSDGRVAVIGPIDHLVRFYAGATGDYLGQADLQKQWGREPSYTSDLWADGDGGLIVNNFEGKPPIVRIDADGRIRSEFTPHRPNGKPMGDYFDIQRSPSGELWTTDRDSLLRLSSAGAIDKTLGRLPSATDLTEISTLDFDRTNRIYAMDSKTSAVHVFDRHGAWLHSCIPHFTVESNDSLPLARTMSVSPNGEVVIRSFPAFENTTKMEVIRFTRDGRRAGPAQPRGLGPRQWASVSKAVLFQDSRGHTLRAITHRPDGPWLRDMPSVSTSSTGSLMVFDRSWIEPGSHLSLYSSTGKPIRTIELPAALGRIDDAVYNGRLIVVTASGSLIGISPQGRFLWRFRPHAADDTLTLSFTHEGRVLAVQSSDEIGFEQFATP